MKVVLHIDAPFGAHRKSWLSPRQSLIIGSSERADLALTQTSLLPQHLLIRCTAAEAHVEPIGESQIAVNGKPTNGCALEHGDRISAHNVTIDVEVLRRNPTPATSSKPEGMSASLTTTEPRHTTPTQRSPEAPAKLSGVSDKSPQAATRLETCWKITQRIGTSVIAAWDSPSQPLTYDVSRQWALAQLQSKGQIFLLVAPGDEPEMSPQGDMTFFSAMHLAEVDRWPMSLRWETVDAASLAAVPGDQPLRQSLWCSFQSAERIQSTLTLLGQGRADDRQRPYPEHMLMSAQAGDLIDWATGLPQDTMTLLTDVFPIVLVQSSPGGPHVITDACRLESPSA